MAQLKRQNLILGNGKEVVVGRKRVRRWSDLGTFWTDGVTSS
jgi:hypothetical protein